MDTDIRRMQVECHPASGHRVPQLVRDTRPQHRQCAHLLRLPHLLLIFGQHFCRSINRRRQVANLVIDRGQRHFAKVAARDSHVLDALGRVDRA